MTFSITRGRHYNALCCDTHSRDPISQETSAMTTLFASLIAALALALATPTLAQPSGTLQVQTPTTRYTGAIQTLTTQTAATVTSAEQSGFNVRAITCSLA